MINYIDLFAGAGGLSEGFTMCGYNPIAHVEMNKEACNTLRTRACYYYLKKENKILLYKNYLSGKITRETLYNSVPSSVIDSVITQTMNEDSMDSLFDKIDNLIKAQNNITGVDLIVGGPPCQAYSLVGRAVKNDGMKSDPRNHLYKLYVQVLKKYNPKMFVFENVPGLLSANKGKYLNDMIKSFDESGYKIAWKILNSNNFGVLQNRHRVILIGWKKDTQFFYPEFADKKVNYTVSVLFDDLPELKPGEEKHNYKKDCYSKYLRDTGIRKSDDVLTWHVARPIIERDQKIYKAVALAWKKDGVRLKYTDLPKELCTHKNRTAFLDRFKVVADNLPASHTVMAHISKDGHYFIHPDAEQARSISVREAARIQSFPDDFFFEGKRTAAFTQIGNAVPPLMAKGIAEELKKQLEGLGNE